MNRDNPPKTSSPVPGAAYIRYSSEMQSDSFSLDAQLRQIKEQAERDGVEIVKVFADPAQSAYRKKYRPGINAMREAARCGEFKVLYVHKVDRLARRLEWSLEIVHELQELDIIFKAVQQPFDQRTPVVLPTDNAFARKLSIARLQNWYKQFTYRRIVNQLFAR